jgi:hypothetical protein
MPSNIAGAATTGRSAPPGQRSDAPFEHHAFALFSPFSLCQRQAET